MTPSFCRRAPETKPSVPRGEGGYRPGDRVELASPLAQGHLESLRFRFLKLREGIRREARREGDDVFSAGPGACEREGADDVLRVRELGDARNDRSDLGKCLAHSVDDEGKTRQSQSAAAPPAEGSASCGPRSEGRDGRPRWRRGAIVVWQVDVDDEEKKKKSRRWRWLMCGSSKKKKKSRR